MIYHTTTLPPSNQAPLLVTFSEGFYASAADSVKQRVWYVTAIQGHSELSLSVRVYWLCSWPWIPPTRLQSLICAPRSALSFLFEFLSWWFMVIDLLSYYYSVKPSLWIVLALTSMQLWTPSLALKPCDSANSLRSWEPELSSAVHLP